MLEVEGPSAYEAAYSHALGLPSITGREIDTLYPLAIPATAQVLTLSPLQAAYNLTGANLSPTNMTLTRRIQSAMQKALGTNVNATLLRVAAAGGAADSSPSPSDALTGPSLTPADGSTAGAHPAASLSISE